MDSKIIIDAKVEYDKKPLFTLSDGRTLAYSAVMYIVSGTGYFEDALTPRSRVEPGSVFFLYERRKHKFDPDPNTRWTEAWVLFDAKLAEAEFGNIIPDTPLHKIGLDHNLLVLYEDLTYLDSLNTANSTLGQYLFYRILMEIHLKINNIAVPLRNSLIERCRRAMGKSLADGKEFDLREFSNSESLSYETVRKRFREAVGQSPQTYLTMLKITQAKCLLLKPDISIKEISEQLLFDSPYYFSRVFKKLESVSPETYRRKIILNQSEY